ncbi:DUF5983 family protein [Paraburkholderia tropica]|uniref:DUF5983 family protein n=1 Tax=Paraburkholderia tropica TaxID=92647 RepID=UPI002AB7011A|nr:hypothetical protein [Paraburkholderia tropica]
MEILTVPVVSSGHLSISTRRELDRVQQDCPWTVVAVYREGWFMYAGEEHDDCDDTPPDLRAALAWARQAGHEWIRFDGAGPYVNALTRYE